MAVEYLGLSKINGSIVILENVKDASYDEIIEFTVNDEEKKLGRIIGLYEDKVVVQVFESTDNMSLENVRSRLTGSPMQITLSRDILGRSFNGIGKPIDNLPPIFAGKK